MSKSKARKRDTWDSARLNALAYEYYYDMIKSIAISSIEWHNLPPEIDSRFLELTLFDAGMAVFFKDEVVDLFVALTTQIGGNLDIYRIPQERVAYSVNNYNVPLTSQNSVLIFNNKLHTPDIGVAQLYASKLRDIDMAIQINVNAQKTPIIIRSSQEQKLTLENLAMDYMGNAFMVLADKGLQINPIEVINTGAPYVAGDLQFLKAQILTEVLGYFGIEANPTTKQERLVRDEIDSSMGFVMASRYNRLDARQEACDIINRMFGLDIYVTFREDLMSGTAGETTGVTPPDEATPQPNSTSSQNEVVE